MSDRYQVRIEYEYLLPPEQKPTSVMIKVAEQELRDEGTVERPICLPEDLPESAKTMSFLGGGLRPSEDVRRRGSLPDQFRVAFLAAIEAGELAGA